MVNTTKQIIFVLRKLLLYKKSYDSHVRPTCLKNPIISTLPSKVHQLEDSSSDFKTQKNKITCPSYSQKNQAKKARFCNSDGQSLQAYKRSLGWMIWWGWYGWWMDGWIICGQSAGYDSIVQCALFYYVKGVVTQSVWTWYYFAEPQNIKRLLA